MLGVEAGFLVKALRDRGVEAWGIDSSGDYHPEVCRLKASLFAGLGRSSSLYPSRITI